MAFLNDRVALANDRQMTVAPAQVDSVDLLGRLKSMFQESESMTSDSRTLAMRDREYYDGEQWTKEELEALRARKQPPHVSNRVKRKIDFLVGMEIKTRTDPQALPRTEVEEQRAEVSTDILRFIQSDCRLPVTFTAGSADVMIEGLTGVEVIGVQKKKGVDVAVNVLAWNTIFYDPRSTKPDFSDARYKGVAKWMDKDDALATWGNSDDPADAENRRAAIEGAFQDGIMHNGFDDKPGGGNVWASSDRKRLLVISICYREAGVWNYAIYTGGGVVEHGPSPYLDDEGNPECFYILTSGYIKKSDNSRYGLVRDMIGPQDEINHRRSKLLHMLNVRQVIAETGAVDDVDKARRNFARPDSWTEVKPDKYFEIVKNEDQVAGQAALLQEAKDEIEQLGPNAGLIGRGVESQSGRAIQAQQQSGMTELALIYENLRDWRERVYRSAHFRARQFWTDEKVIRVTDQEGAPKFITLNKSVPLIDQMTGQPVIDPTTGQPAIERVENQVSDFDDDITVGEGADVNVIAQEQFDKLLELAKFGITFPPEFYVRASSLRNKKELLDSLKKKTEKPPEQVQAEQDMLDIEHETAAANINDKNASAMQKTAAAQKLEAETFSIIKTAAQPPAPPRSAVIPFRQQAGA